MMVPATVPTIVRQSMVASIGERSSQADADKVTRFACDRDDGSPDMRRPWLFLLRGIVICVCAGVQCAQFRAAQPGKQAAFRNDPAGATILVPGRSKNMRQLFRSVMIIAV